MDAPTIGHNSAGALPFDPDVIAALTPRVLAFAEGAGQWLDRGAIETEDAAEKVQDFLTGARKLATEVDEARTAAKRPHDLAAKAVQAAYRPMVDVLDALLERVKASLTVYARTKAEKVKLERAAAAREARLAHEAAEAARKAAQGRNDVVGEVQANAALTAAAKSERDAARPIKTQIQSASGGARPAALRSTTIVDEVTNLSQLFVHYRGRDEVRDLLIRLANAELRASGGDADIPGITTTQRETVA